MLEKRDWLAREADEWRRAVMLEPRGHPDMSGALLTEPVSPGSHAGVLFLDSSGYGTMSGHGIIVVTTIALECGLIVPGGDAATLAFDTPAGTIRANAYVGVGVTDEARRVERVVFVGVPSFVLQAGLPVTIGHRKFHADLAFGGAFYSMVDSEAARLPIDAAHVPELRRAGMAIAKAIDGAHAIVHPLEARLAGRDRRHDLHGPTGPRAGGARERFHPRGGPDGSVARRDGHGRNHGGTQCDGLDRYGDAVRGRGPDGTHFAGRIVARTAMGDYPAIVPEIDGSGWITGEHTFLIDEDDPLREEFHV